MTYRLLLWFDMLEEEGKSTKRIRGLFTNRTPILSRDLSHDYGNSGVLDGKGVGSGYGNGGNGIGNGTNFHVGNGNGYDNGNGSGRGILKIVAVKYDI